MACRSARQPYVSSPGKPRVRSRHIPIETLELRQLFAGDTVPTVDVQACIEVSSTNGSSSGFQGEVTDIDSAHASELLTSSLADYSLVGAETAIAYVMAIEANFAAPLVVVGDSFDVAANNPLVTGIVNPIPTPVASLSTMASDVSSRPSINQSPTPSYSTEPTPSYSNGPSLIASSSPTPTYSPSPTPSESPSPTPTYSFSPTPTYSSSPSPTYSSSPTPTYSSSPTPSYSPSPTPSYSPSPTPSSSGSPSPTYSSTPSPSDGSFSTRHDSTLYGSVYGYDADGDTISASVDTGPSHGTLTLNADLSFSYVPNFHFVGIDHFSYTVSDGSSTSSPATITIDVFNHAPTGNGQSFRVAVGGAITQNILINNSDSDGDPITAVLTSGPAQASLFTFNSNGSFVYKAGALAATDTFKYQLTDGLTYSEPIAVEISILPVQIDIYADESQNSSSLQLDHYEASDSSLESFWVQPQRYYVRVILPDVASPSDYIVQLSNGSTVELTSTGQTFEFYVTPDVSGGTISVSATAVLAVDPTVQVADDSEEAPFTQWRKEINGKVKGWIGNLAESGFKSVLANRISDPFDEAKSAINESISNLNPITDVTKIITLENFRDHEIDALRDAMVDKVTGLVFDQVLHSGTVTSLSGSRLRAALDAVDDVDISTAMDKQFLIDPIFKFHIDEATRTALLNGDTSLLKAKLEKPWELLSDIGIGVTYFFNTQASVNGTLTISNLSENLKAATYKADINIFNVPVGAFDVNLQIMSRYTPATDVKGAGITAETNF